VLFHGKPESQPPAGFKWKEVQRGSGLWSQVALSSREKADLRV